MGNWPFCDVIFQILRKRFAARNLKCFDFYYFCVLSELPSRQQIYFQNQCFTMEKRLITTWVNWPLSKECWAIQLHFETTFAHRARTRFHTQIWKKNTQNLGLTGLFGIWFFHGVTCLSSSLNAFQMQYMGGLYMPYSFSLVSTAFLPVW